MEDTPAKRVEDHIYKAVLTLAGLSLGINSYLVKEKVAEISDNLKSLSTAIRQLELTGVATSQQLAHVTARVDQNISRIDRHELRIHAVEEALAKASLKIGLDFKRGATP